MACVVLHVPRFPYGDRYFLKVRMGVRLVRSVDFLFPPAHAGLGSFLWGAVNFIVPFESVGILAQQLYYLARNDDRFDRVELIVSALGTLSIIPVAKPLKPLLPAIRVFLKTSSKLKPEFYKSVGGPMGHAIKEAAFGRTALVRDWLVILVLISEMIIDEEAREALVFLLNTVQSEDDLNAIVQWLTLPADGWIGEGLARAETGLSADNTDGMSLLNDMVGFFIKDADAANIRTAVPVARLIQAIKPLTKMQRANFIRGVKATVTALRNPRTTLRLIAHSPQMIAASSRLLSGGLKAVQKNAQTLRIDPIALVSMIAYIESRQNCQWDPFATYVTCVPFPPRVSDRLNGKWELLITRVATGIGQIGGNQHGSVFHLMVLAAQQLEFEFGANPYRPVAQELTNTINVTSGNVSIGLDRNVDIVLDLTDEVTEESIWIEAKSLGRRSLGAPQWTVGAGKTSRHRQFALDCSAWKTSKSSGFRWWLQNFKAKPGSTVAGPLKADMEKLNDKLHVMPKKAVPSEFGETLASAKICKFQDAQLFTIFNKFWDTMLTGLSQNAYNIAIASLPPPPI